MSPTEDAQGESETDGDPEAGEAVGQENADASSESSGGFLSRVTGMFSGGGDSDDADESASDDGGDPEWVTSSDEPAGDAADDDPVSPGASVEDPFESPGEGQSPDDDPFGDDSTGGDAGDVTATPSDPGENADGTEPEATVGATEDPIEDDQALEDPFEEMEGAFDDTAADVTDPDDVWASLTGAEKRGSVDTSGERAYAEVSKHDYCERCEYFSGPPDVHCNHEGTDILEFVDMDTVRVVDCPVVAERKGLEQGRAHGEFADAGED